MTVNSIVLCIFIEISLNEGVLFNTQCVCLLVNLSELQVLKLILHVAIDRLCHQGAADNHMTVNICIKPKLFQMCQEKNDIIQILIEYFYLFIVCHCVQSVLINS